MSENPYLIASDWFDMPWWPTGKRADIRAGWTGHDNEIVVNIEGYDHHEYIPDLVFRVFQAQLPETWKCENRSTRIEVHPSGRLFGGYEPMDISVVGAALIDMGLVIGLVSDEKAVEDDIG